VACRRHARHVPEPCHHEILEDLWPWGHQGTRHKPVWAQELHNAQQPAQSALSYYHETTADLAHDIVKTHAAMTHSVGLEVGEPHGRTGPALRHHTFCQVMWPVIQAFNFAVSELAQEPDSNQTAHKQPTKPVSTEATSSRIRPGRGILQARAAERWLTHTLY
jgi:hypothetical protein